MSVHAVTGGEQFEAYLNQQGIAFIDFWAKWCGPCKGFEKTFLDIASENEDISFASVDIESQPELVEALQIRSVPHLMVIKDGVIIYSEAGALAKTALKELVSQARDAVVEQ